MATHKEIQAPVKQTYGFVPETCWIADVKNRCGLPMSEAPTERAKPGRSLPLEKVLLITRS